MTCIRKFVTAAAICADKTLITLNILNPNEHALAAQQTLEGKRIHKSINLKLEKWLALRARIIP